nr:hypothetical protein Q903MT_gene2261 [Picea sitchensis]
MNYLINSLKTKSTRSRALPIGNLRLGINVEWWIRSERLSPLVRGERLIVSIRARSCQF